MGPFPSARTPRKFTGPVWQLRQRVQCQLRDRAVVRLLKRPCLPEFMRSRAGGRLPYGGW